MQGRVLLLAAAGLLVAADKADDASKKDLERLQGDWRVASQTIDGNKLSDDESQGIFRTVKDTTYTVFFFEKQVGKGTFTIDATKKPKTIDSRPETPGKESPPMLGIYELDSDTLRTCYAPAGKERPKAFESKPDSGLTLTVWKREKK
jgi:uncharacterized protein (TIGR03067 family)